MDGNGPLTAPEVPEEILALVAEQADDDGLWFQAVTAPEAYLQGELRRLHAAIEGEPWPPPAR